MEESRKGGGEERLLCIWGVTEAVYVYMCKVCGATMRFARSDSFCSLLLMMMRRDLDSNDISSLEAGAFADLRNLESL